MIGFGAEEQPVVEPVVTKKIINDDMFEIHLDLRIAEGWHVYSIGTSEDGPTWASCNIENDENVQTIGDISFSGDEIKVFDKVFDSEVRYFEKKVTFRQKVKISDISKVSFISGYFTYGACNNENCLPPSNVEFSYSIPSKNITKSRDGTITKENTTEPQPSDTAVDYATSASPATLNLPVITTDSSKRENNEDSSLWFIFLSCFIAGFIALVTPCVWPIIPMTVSYFLKRSQNKSQSIRDSVIYGLSIVIIYVSLGLLVTLWRGASGLNELSTNAVVNIFFAVLLLVFGISFLGAFELTLPSSWSSAVDNSANRAGGLLGIFLMAFTLSLVSFSCTGPIIGFLLVELSSGTSLVAPIIGMLGFAFALALPFAFFALFPSLLKKMPRSGSWMVTVKVVLGFIEIAFALKFLSVADLAYGWGILPRETFITIWAALSLSLGLYLLGILRITHDDNSEGIGVTRLSLGIISISFFLYLLPGLWGAPLNAVSAFVPPMHTQDFVLGKSIPKSKYKSFDEAFAESQRTGKNILIDFTGHGCVNCRQMEQSVWSDPRVADILENDYILVSLYVDDKTPLKSGNQQVTEQDGKTSTIRTEGDKWSYFQRYNFGVNAQPFYVKINSNGCQIRGEQRFTTNVDEFISFLKDN